MALELLKVAVDEYDSDRVKLAAIRRCLDRHIIRQPIIVSWQVTSEVRCTSYHVVLQNISSPSRICFAPPCVFLVGQVVSGAMDSIVGHRCAAPVGDVKSHCSR
jgi:hypothetical protein